MRKTFRISVLLLAAMLAAATVWTAPVLAADPGVISGKIVNKTQGGAAVGALEVTLTTIVRQVPTTEQKATTDPQGNFSFAGLSTDSNYSYVVSATYRNVDYGSDIIQLTATVPSQTIEVEVYDTTNSDSAISMISGHMVVFPVAQGQVAVLEAWAVANAGDRTYVGPAQGTQATARFTLPAGATDFSADFGFSEDAASGTVLYTLPLSPGVSTLTYSYGLSYKANNLVVSRKMEYPVAAFGILVPQQGVTARSGTLAQSAPQTIQGTTFVDYAASDLRSGQTVDISITISPQAFVAPPPDTGAAGGGTQNKLMFYLPWTLSAVLALALAFVLLRPRFKREPRRARVAVTRTETAEMDAEQESLLEQMGRLDYKFESGQIQDDEYRSERAQLKERLAKVRSRKNA